MEGKCEKCGKLGDLEVFKGNHLCKMCALDSRFKSRINESHKSVTFNDNNNTEANIVIESNKSNPKLTLTDYVEEFIRNAHCSLNTVKKVLGVLFGVLCLYIAHYFDAHFIIYVIIIVLTFILKELIGELIYGIFGRAISVVLGVIVANFIGNIFLKLYKYLPDNLLVLLISSGIGLFVTLFIGYGTYFLSREILGIPVDITKHATNSSHRENADSSTNNPGLIDRTYLLSLEDRLRDIDREIDSKQSDLFHVSSKFSFMGVGGGLDSSEYDYYKGLENKLEGEIDELRREKEKIEDDIRDYENKFGL